LELREATVEANAQKVEAQRHENTKFKIWLETEKKKNAQEKKRIAFELAELKRLQKEIDNI
jgi:hypothetical protein